MHIAQRSPNRLSYSQALSGTPASRVEPASSTPRPSAAVDTYAPRALGERSPRAEAVTSEVRSSSPQEFRVAAVVVPKRIPKYAAYDRRHHAALVREHHEYVAALVQLGFRVMTLDNDPRWAASIFPEDPAVIIDADNVVITVPGSDHRTGEDERMAEFFRTQYPTMKRHEMRRVPDAYLDGGDVLRVGRHLYIGLSNHTSEVGAEYLAGIAREANLVPHIIPSVLGLHLKSSCTLATANRIFYDEALTDSDFLELLKTQHECEAVEQLGSNVLYLGRSPATGRDCALVSRSAPDTAQRLRDLGLSVVEVAKAAHEALDGRVTCSSVRIPERDAWCT